MSSSTDLLMSVRVIEGRSEHQYLCLSLCVIRQHSPPANPAATTPRAVLYPDTQLPHQHQPTLPSTWTPVCPQPQPGACREVGDSGGCVHSSNFPVHQPDPPSSQSHYCMCVCVVPGWMCPPPPLPIPSPLLFELPERRENSGGATSTSQQPATSNSSPRAWTATHAPTCIHINSTTSKCCPALASQRAQVQVCAHRA